MRISLTLQNVQRYNCKIFPASSWPISSLIGLQFFNWHKNTCMCQPTKKFPSSLTRFFKRPGNIQLYYTSSLQFAISKRALEDKTPIYQLLSLFDNLSFVAGASATSYVMWYMFTLAQLRYAWSRWKHAAYCSSISELFSTFAIWTGTSY